jgi:soluble P-type ATPase
MPYSVTNSADGCQGWAVIKDATGEVIGCHATKTQAEKQLTAVNIAEYGTDDRAAADLDAPEFMRANARRGLELYAQGLAGDGLQPETVRDARAMADGNVSAAKWRKISAWVARHLVDLDAVDDDEITPGVVAHYLWGSGRTRQAAERTKEYADRVIARLDQNRAAKMPIAVTDIDGTLVTASQQPYEPVIEALDELDVAVVVLSGRGENQRAKTERLLEEIDVDYDALILAGSPEGKVDAMADLVEVYDVIAVFENNPETVDAYRKLGVPVTAISQRANMEKAQEIRQKL